MYWNFFLFLVWVFFNLTPKVLLNNTHDTKMTHAAQRCVGGQARNRIMSPTSFNLCIKLHKNHSNTSKSANINYRIATFCESDKTCWLKLMEVIYLEL